MKLLSFLLVSFIGYHLPMIDGQINPYSLPGNYFPFNYSNTHGNHMVLQSNVNASVWGFGALFAPITISLLGGPQNITANVSAYVSSTGIWRVTLPPQMPSIVPYTIIGESSTTNESFIIEDILFGDVVICGGQSNMAYGMGGILNSTAELAQAANRPYMRIFSSQYSAQNFSQLQVVNEYAINWTLATPDSLPGFSAVCYLTAANIYDATNGTIPFGLIDTSVGGTAIQLWFPPLHFNDCASTISPFDVYKWPWSASCWYNGMTSPFTVGPTDMKFFLWDQGENNVGERPFYECAMPLVIRTWRQQFKNYLAPFFFVQLPSYMRQEGDWSLADFREGQLTAAMAEPNVGYIATIDVGDAYDGSIHNRDKSLVGSRLGNAVLSQVYNIPRPYLHPRYQSATAVTSGSIITVTITVGPTPALYGGLTYVQPTFDSNATWCPVARGVNLTFCDWLMIQTNDAQNTWWNATSIKIGSDGASIVLTVDTTPTQNLLAVATRNGYRDWPVTNIYNGANLPLLTWTPKPIETSYIKQGKLIISNVHENN